MLQSKYSSVFVYIGLLIFSILSVLYPMVSHFGLSFIFSTIFLLIILSIYGLPIAVLSTLLTGCAVGFVGGHWISVVLLLTEILVVGLLLACRNWGIFYSVLLYWLLIGLPLFTVYVYAISELDGLFAALALISKLLNNIFCALIAEILVTYVKFGKLTRGSHAKKYSFKFLISHIVLSAVILPYSIFLISDLAYINNQMERSVIGYLHGQVKVITNELDNWNDESILALRLQGFVQVAKIDSLMETIDDQILNVYILDKESHVIYTNLPTPSADPLAKFRGEGYVTKIGNDSYRFAPAKPDGMNDMAIIDDTDYLYTVQFGKDSMRLLIEIPLRQLFEKEIQGFVLKFANLLVFILVGIGITYVLKLYILRTFGKLTETTTGLPRKLKESAHIHWPTSRMIEFNQLTKNFKEMSSEVTSMFGELQESQFRLHHMAYTDSLTGVKNRSYFMEILKDAITAASLEKPLALLYMDLNGFKNINDTLGHEAGDVVLQTISERLTTGCNEAGQLARLGGDEFVMMLPDSPRRSTAQCALSIIELIGLPIDFKEHSLQVGISIGICQYPTDSSSVDELIHHSDMAMYASKTKKQSSFTFYDTIFQEGEESK